MIKDLPEEGVSIVEFVEDEIVRHRLTKYFVRLFEHPNYKKKQQFVPELDKVIKTQPRVINEGGSPFIRKIINFFK